MSYILEGLKKLEEKRRQEEKPPHLLTFQGNSTEKPAKKPIWPYLLVAVLLLNAGIFIWWIGPWRSLKSNSHTPQPVAQKGEPIAAVTTPVEQKKQSEPLPAKEPQQVKVMGSPQTGTAVKVIKEAVPTVAKETPASSKQTSVAAPAPPVKSKSPADGRIVKLSELPPEIKKDLPDLKMSAHFYSTDQQARFARVNDRILHEGETLSEGLKVEGINPGGTVLNYKGYRFQININENR